MSDPSGAIERVAVGTGARSRRTVDHLREPALYVADHPRAERRIVACREARARKTENGIEILPIATFVERLWAGELVR